MQRVSDRTGRGLPRAASATRTAAAVREDATRKPTRTRKALIEAGKRLISDGRMDAATIDDIVREADVAKGSFYNHFADREALRRHVLDHVNGELVAFIDRVNAGVDDTPTYFARGMLASLVYALDRRVSARVLLHPADGMVDPAHPRNARVAHWLRKGMAEGSLAIDDLDAGLVLVLGIADLAITRLLELEYDRPRARDVMRGVCTGCLRALGVDPRRIARITDESLARIVGPVGGPHRRPHGHIP